MISLLRATYCVLRDTMRSKLRFMHVSACLVAGITVLGATIGCSDVGTSPTVAVALAFDTLPSPSVVYGDTLRDINGVATPLTGHAYNADGNEIPNARIEYFAADGATATIDRTCPCYLIATSDPAKTQIVLRAQIGGGIPSLTARTLQIVPLPDTVDRVNRSLVDTLNYAGTDTIPRVSAALALRVLDRPDSTNSDSVRGVRAWLVRFQVVSPAGADSLLVNDAGLPSTLDTTGSDGVASRTIRLRPNRGGNLSTGVPDSVIVEATARNRAGVLPGAPVRYILILRKST